MELKENDLYIVKDGELKKIDKPKTGFGRQTILWQNGKVTNVEVSYTNKISY